jgi:hypothetical protein
MGTKYSLISQDKRLMKLLQCTSFAGKLAKLSAEDCGYVEHLTATDIKNNHVPVFVFLTSSDLAK